MNFHLIFIKNLILIDEMLQDFHFQYLKHIHISDFKLSLINKLLYGFISDFQFLYSL